MKRRTYLSRMNRMLKNSFASLRMDIDRINARLDSIESSPAKQASVEEVSSFMSRYNKPEMEEGRVRITAVQFEAPGSEKGNLNGEWVELTGYNVDMTGWVLHDKNKKHVYKFPQGFTIYGSVKVFTGKGINTTTKLFWNNPRPIWNDDEDIAVLIDSTGRIASQVRSSRTHTFEELV